MIKHILELNMVTYGFNIANALDHTAMNIGGRGGGRAVERGGLIVIVHGVVWYYCHSRGSFGLVFTVLRSEDLDRGRESIEYMSHSRIISVHS